MLYDLWKVSGLDSPAASLRFCGLIADPLDAHTAARDWGGGDYQVWTPTGELVREFTLMPQPEPTPQVATVEEQISRNAGALNLLAG